MWSLEKLRSELAEIEKALPHLEAGAVYVGVVGDGGEEHRRYLARAKDRREELRSFLG